MTLSAATSRDNQVESEQISVFPPPLFALLTAVESHRTNSNLVHAPPTLPPHNDVCLTFSFIIRIILGGQLYKSYKTFYN
jgi:hypothetical protein